MNIRTLQNSTSYPGSFLYAGKDSGWRWSRDARKFDYLRDVGKVSTYMFPLCTLSFSITAMLDYLGFLSCLGFPVLNSMYENRILKPKQVLCMLLSQQRCNVCLPTSYDKSLISHLLPILLFAKCNLGI